jgi:hypothetical protein
MAHARLSSPTQSGFLTDDKTADRTLRGRLTLRGRFPHRDYESGGK